MLSQKSDDGPHIAVKTLCNNTPNSSPQYTQMPLQDWAVFIMPFSHNLHISPLSSTTPKECDFWGQLQYNKMHPYGPSRYLQQPAPLWCCVEWHNRLAHMVCVYIYIYLYCVGFNNCRTQLSGGRLCYLLHKYQLHVSALMAIFRLMNWQKHISSYIWHASFIRWKGWGYFVGWGYEISCVMCREGGL